VDIVNELSNARRMSNMGRKDAARFIKIEKRIETLEEGLMVVMEKHKQTYNESKKNWKDIRDAITKIIEGD
jgi:hypothetical protein